MKLIPVIVAASLFAGCGYMGDPLPPLANIPSRVNDLVAVQRGARLIVEFSAPKLTTEGVAIKREPTLDLRAGPAGAPFDEGAWASQAKQWHPVRGDKTRIRTEIPIDSFINKEIVIGVKVVGENGKDAGWSNLAVVPVLPEPERPRSVRAESVAGGVKVTWQAAGPQFRVFRRSGEGDFALVGTVDKPEYIDTSVEIGKSYDYRLETVVRFGEKEAESETSSEVRVVPEDRFAPGIPTGLGALASPGSIELTWDQNPEPDVAGYRVYRAVAAEEFRKVGETTGIPSYSDRQVEAGKVYRYSVAAFDRGGNEGGRSAVVEAALP